MALAQPLVRMLCDTDLRNRRCRAGVGLCGEEGAAGPMDESSVQGCWGSTRHGQLGTVSLPPCLQLSSTSLVLSPPSKTAPHPTQSPMSPQMTTHPTVHPSTRHYAHRHSYLKAAQTFKLPPSQP